MSLHHQFRLAADAIASLIKSQNFPAKTVGTVAYPVSAATSFYYRPRSFDSVVIIETWWLKEYARNVKNLPARATVIDIGGHIGTFSLYIAAHFPSAQVFAYEPNPQNYQLLVDNLHLNQAVSRVKAFNLAVTSVTGQKLKLYHSSTNTGANSLVTAGNPDSFTLCRTISLKDIFAHNKLKHCHLLKIDCEGGEYDILLNTPDSILKSIDSIILEYHPGGDIHQVKTRLETLGFVCSFDHAVNLPVFKKLINAPLLVAVKK